MDYPIKKLLYFDKEKKQIVRAFVTIGFNEESMFGIYDLAERKLDVQYTYKDKCKKARNENTESNKNLCTYF